MSVQAPSRRSHKARGLHAAFDRHRKAKRTREVDRHIEAFLKSKGVPRPARTKQADGWHLLLVGSAVGRVGVVESGGELFPQAEAVVMDKLPSDRELALH